ncbi:MAG: hypothetical protein WCD49_18220 [Candidatus Acidiferrales bacterium]
MTGKCYYITTLGAWRRHATRFVNSHWVALNETAPAVITDEPVSSDATPIIVLVEADEGAHLALEDDAAFEALPHPLAQKPISSSARAALASHDIPYGATTFDVAEAVGRAHPLLRHRVF